MNAIQRLLCSAAIAAPVAFGLAEDDAKEAEREALRAWAHQTLDAEISLEESVDGLALDLAKDNRNEMLAANPLLDGELFLPAPAWLAASLEPDASLRIEDEEKDVETASAPLAADGRAAPTPRPLPASS